MLVAIAKQGEVALMAKLTSSSIALGAICAVPVAVAEMRKMPIETVGMLALAGVTVNVVFALLERRRPKAGDNRLRGTEADDRVEPAVDLVGWLVATAGAVALYAAALWLVH